MTYPAVSNRLYHPGMDKPWKTHARLVRREKEQDQHYAPSARITARDPRYLRPKLLVLFQNITYQGSSHQKLLQPFVRYQNLQGR